MTDALALLKARFLERCRLDLDRLRARPGDDELVFIVHRLAGSAGSFGLPAIGVVAARIDATARTGEPPPASEIEALCLALERELDAGGLEEARTDDESTRT